MRAVAITRRACLTLLGGAAVIWPCAVLAQTPAKVSRLGVLSGGVPVADASPVGAALLRGLAQHGYALGRNGGPDAQTHGVAQADGAHVAPRGDAVECSRPGHDAAVPGVGGWRPGAGPQRPAARGARARRFRAGVCGDAAREAGRDSYG